MSMPAASAAAWQARLSCRVVRGLTGFWPGNSQPRGRACHATAQAAGIDKRVSLHTLRHSFATHLLEQKVDIRVIQVLLGHKKLDTTALYSQVATRTICEVKSPLGHLSMTVKPPA